MEKLCQAFGRVPNMNPPDVLKMLQGFWFFFDAHCPWGRCQLADSLSSQRNGADGYYLSASVAVAGIIGSPRTGLYENRKARVSLTIRDYHQRTPRSLFPG